jgi:hypothetical protein
MPKYSMKRDGKEVGPASVYAEPHKIRGTGAATKGTMARGPMA